MTTNSDLDHIQILRMVGSVILNGTSASKATLSFTKCIKTNTDLNTYNALQKFSMTLET